MKNLILLSVSLFSLSSLAQVKGGHNTFFSSATCGNMSIHNPSGGGGNPYMQNTTFASIFDEGDGKVKLHMLDLSVNSNTVVLYQGESKSSQIQIEFNKDDVFSIAPEIEAKLIARSGPLKGERLIKCTVVWSEVIGPKVILHNL